MLSRRTFLQSLAAGLGAVGTAVFAPKPLPKPEPPKISPPAFTGQWVEYPISYGPNTTDERHTYNSRAFFERAFPIKPTRRVGLPPGHAEYNAQGTLVRYGGPA